MSHILTQPFQSPPPQIKYQVWTADYSREKKLGPQLVRYGKGMGGFFSDVGDFFSDGITGLVDAVGNALDAVGNAIGQIGETVALIVRAAIGDVEWSEVLGSIGAIFQDIGKVMVYLNPIRIYSDWLSTTPLTAHAFNELDKFTGGMLTTANNVSTLVGRAMRGDSISKEELLADIIFIVQVCLIVFTAGAWVAIGASIGTMVGREVCKHQTHARDACMVTFQIIGAAAGGYSQAIYGAGFSAAEEAAWLAGDEAYAEFLANEAAAGTMSLAEENAWLAGDEAYAAFVEQEAQAAAAASSTSFLTHLSTASQNYLNTVGIDVATQQAIQACQSSDLIGNNECKILGQIASDYVKSPDDMPWEEFLGAEVGRLGVEQLMLQWFPQDSPEHRAIQAQWQIKYVDVPVDQTVVVKKQFDPKTLLLLASGVALAMVGAS